MLVAEHRIGGEMSEIGIVPLLGSNLIREQIPTKENPFTSFLSTRRIANEEIVMQDIDVMLRDDSRWRERPMCSRLSLQAQHAPLRRSLGQIRSEREIGQSLNEFET
jgi:hypothetical protein